MASTGSLTFAKKSSGIIYGSACPLHSCNSPVQKKFKVKQLKLPFRGY